MHWEFLKVLQVSIWIFAPKKDSLKHTLRNGRNENIISKKIQKGNIQAREREKREII